MKSAQQAVAVVLVADVADSVAVAVVTVADSVAVAVVTVAAMTRAAVALGSSSFI